MADQTEIELKFLVPQHAREAVVAGIGRGKGPVRTQRLAAMYLDTGDRRLAQGGFAWRLRLEHDRWVQTLKAGGASALERFEHEVARPDATWDAARHAGTPAGDALLAIVSRASHDGVEVGVRFRTEIQRLTRRVRTRGALVEIAFDEGFILSGAARVPVREIEFELVSGSTSAMLAMVERWRERFDLVYDPRSKAERGDRLAQGSAFPPLRKAKRARYARDADAPGAYRAVLDECLAHVAHNAIGLVEGDPGLRVEHVHQFRVGIRRLRSALRSFEDWVPQPPSELVDGLRKLFAALSASRDADVFESGVAAALARAGAPPPNLPAAETGPDPAGIVCANDTQRLLLAWLSWHASLAESAAEDNAASPEDQGDADVAAAGNGQTPPRAPGLRKQAERRLARWHRRIGADWKAFDELDETRLHSLRKRIKRQRYAVEFFEPVLRARKVERYLKPLAVIQDRMGELNDLFVAQARFRTLTAGDPAAWFALGWLAARIEQVRALAKPELARLARTDPPRARARPAD